jgi:transposase InsO family protein
VYFLRKKSKVFEHLKDFKAHAETQSGRKIKILHIDNGGEYVNRYVQHICSEVGIQLQHTVPYTPQQNGVAERKNISLKEMATCMLHAISLPPKLWVEALNCANHIQNISPHRSVKDQTPFEAWSGNKPEVTHFQIFGSRAWAHVPSEKRKALDP